jgi:hypothetical protein
MDGEDDPKRPTTEEMILTPLTKQSMHIVPLT